MKIAYPFLFLFLHIFGSQAQESKASTLLSTGSNIIWDFSQLQLSETKDTILYLDTSNVYHIPNCNLLLKELTQRVFMSLG